MCLAQYFDANHAKARCSIQSFETHLADLFVRMKKKNEIRKNVLFL